MEEITKAEAENFNSRPHGGRPFRQSPVNAYLIFQLTPSRRATVYRETIRYNRNISTHALTEGDQALDCLPPTLPFQLTPSRRATSAVFSSATYGIFQLTRLCLFNISIFSSSFHLPPPPNSIFSAKIL